jgi:uncharacterized protein YjbJ (UPF0337 family)
MAHPTTAPAPKQPEWAEQKTKLKAKFPNLMESDFHFQEGKREEMIARIQKKLGKSKSEFTEILKAL